MASQSLSVRGVAVASPQKTECQQGINYLKCEEGWKVFNIPKNENCGGEEDVIPGVVSRGIYRTSNLGDVKLSSHTWEGSWGGGKELFLLFEGLTSFTPQALFPPLPRMGGGRFLFRFHNFTTYRRAEESFRRVGESL